MFPVLTLSILFMIILTYYLKKNTSAQQEVEAQFWDKESKANTTRRQDISNLNYITIPFEKFPQKLHNESEKTLESLATQKIIDLSEYSNTDLKLKYGVANLALLTQYESNYYKLQSTLETYAKELLDCGYNKEAVAILDYAKSIGMNNQAIQALLAEASTTSTH